MMHKRRLAGPASVALAATVALASQQAAQVQAQNWSAAADTNIARLLGRRLEDVDYQQQQDEEQDNYHNNDNGNPYDLSTYSIRFEKCQNVISWNDDLAEEEDATTVLGLEHFVIFRLCPSDSCRTSCSSDYGVPFGEYVLPVEDYLASATEQSRRAFENTCQQCEEACNEGGYCDESCLDDCETYENLGDNGYWDATDYMECQQIDVVNGDDDNAGGEGNNEAEDQQLYIGPKCSANGRRIYIGLFTDEDCSVKYELPEHKTMKDFIGFKLWYGTLSATYDHSSSMSSGCISCAEDNEDGDGNDNDKNDADEVNEMCEELYNAAGKCETKHGISAGFMQTKREDGNNENQANSEVKVCTFIDSLVLESYTEKGEINLNVIQDVVIRKTTSLQKICLSILSLFIVGTLSYAVWLNRAINIAFPSVNDLFQCTDRSTLA